jgi:hypothetical protein
MAVALARCREGKRNVPGEIRRAVRVHANEDLLAKLQSGSGK